MLEKEIEARLRRLIHEGGGLCLKFESPGFTGVPDRIILVPGGAVAFVELKAPGKKERPRQRYVQKQLRALGCTVFSCVDSMEKIQEVAAWAAAKATPATHLLREAEIKDEVDTR